MSEIRRAVVKSYDAGTHKADVQIAGSLAVWLDAVRVATNIPAADVVAGRQCTVLFLDPSNQDDAVVFSIQGALPSTGSILVATATSALTLTTTAQSIVGDGNIFKVRILLPTPGDWLIEATCDFLRAGSDPGSMIGELFVNDSGSAESASAIFDPSATNERATVTQRWKVTTTAADTPVELKGKSTISAGATLRSAHTRITATGPNRTAEAVPAPADTVVSETNFGQAAAAGSDTPYSRRNHTHGTPTNPITAHAATVDAHAMLAALNTWAALQTFSAGIDVDAVISMANATANRLEFGTAGVAAPGASSAGMKIKLYGADGVMATSDYALGISAFTMWFNTDRDFKWHVDSAATPKMLYDGVNDYFSLDGAGGTRFGFNVTNFNERIRLYGLNVTASGTARWGFGIQDWSFIMFMDGSAAGTNGAFVWRQCGTGSDPSTGGDDLMKIHTDGTFELPLGMLCFSTVANLTIATGAVTAARSYHTITSESGTSDDLDTISVSHGGPEDGSVLVLRAVAGHTITAKDGTGNLNLGADVTLIGSNGDTLTLIYDGTNWNKIAASTN